MDKADQHYVSGVAYQIPNLSLLEYGLKLGQYQETNKFKWTLKEPELHKKVVDGSKKFLVEVKLAKGHLNK